jgi:hypothetical protein
MGRTKRRAKIAATVLSDQPHLRVIELNRPHSHPDAARGLDLTAPDRIDDRVAGGRCSIRRAVLRRPL